MTGLFDCSSDNISLHLKKSVDRGLNEDSVAEKISATAAIGTYKKHIQIDENVAVAKIATATQHGSIESKPQIRETNY